jgi:hypothetical protein
MSHKIYLKIENSNYIKTASLERHIAVKDAYESRIWLRIEDDLD